MKQALQLDHLQRLTDAIGIHQHAIGPEPNPEFGYCLDDNARALIVVLRAHALTGDAGLLCYADKYLAFVERAQRPDGRFRNFMDAQGIWLEEVGAEDANGRAVWALGFALRYASDDHLRSRAQRLLERALPAAAGHEFLRSKAFSLLGLRHWLAVESSPAVTELARSLAQDLAGAYEGSAGEGWRWFEDQLTYCNASLAEAMLGTAHEIIGLESLGWLCQTMEKDGVLSLIGNHGWFVRGRAAALFDQQPVDAAGVSSACATAYRRTGEARFERWGRMAFGWFLGENITRERMIDRATGGCYDGLEHYGHNANQGAESLLAWLSTHEDMLELGWIDI